MGIFVKRKVGVSVEQLIMLGMFLIGVFLTFGSMGWIVSLGKQDDDREAVGCTLMVVGIIIALGGLFGWFWLEVT
jgi:hypothetical protein